ncbi:MAG: hypothetical protein AN485_17745 [Anabaena sp. MDT14b]|jgi:hypothetical protein|nr:MAG: hypothetical protein AN485_17745 [Anabaena sp. MDT14b]
MKPLKDWNQYPLIEVKGLQTEEGECRLLEGYIVQRYNENGLWLFSEVVDLMQCTVISAEAKQKNTVVDVATQGLIGGMLGQLIGGRAGAEIGSNLAAWGAASETIVEIVLQLEDGLFIRNFRIIIDRSTVNIIESIFNCSFKRSASISTINQNLKKQAKDAQRAALGCFGIFGVAELRYEIPKLNL